MTCIEIAVFRSRGDLNIQELLKTVTWNASYSNNVPIETTVAVPVDKISIAPSIREVRDLLGYLESNTNDNIDEHSVVDLEH